MNHSEYLKLVAEVLRWNTLYYQDGIQEVKDVTYDSALASLRDYERKNKTLVSAITPTRTVGHPSKNKTYPHTTPMYSLSNCMDFDDVDEWLRALVKVYGEELEIVVEMKYDGMAGELKYVDGVLRQGLKRGDGFSGEELTCHALASRYIPAEIPDTTNTTLYGEFLVDRSGFARANESRVNNGLEPYANQRSAIAGILNTLAPFEDSAEVIFIPYDILVEGMFFTHQSLKIEYFNAFGFTSNGSLLTTPVGVKAIIEGYKKRRDSLPFDIDGLVLKVNSVTIQSILGHTTTSPRWATAYKFEAEKVPGYVTGIVFQVGRTGEICPVAKINPVKVGGATITSIQLHNEDKLKEYDLHPGDEVEVYRSADCIPKFGKKLRTIDGLAPYSFIKNCPCCQSVLFKEGAIHYCKNPECGDVIIGSLTYLTSKPALDISGLGGSTTRQFYETGLISLPHHIFELTANDIENLPGFTTYSATKLVQNINRARKTPLWRFINCLGIPNVGAVTSRNIASRIYVASALLNLDTPEKILALEIKDVGLSTANSIAEYVVLNRELIIKLLDHLTVAAELQVFSSENIEGVTGKTFVFSGGFPTLGKKGIDSIITDITKSGGFVRTQVSSKTDYLVTGTKPSEAKLEAAEKFKTNIVGISEILALFN